MDYRFWAQLERKARSLLQDSAHHFALQRLKNIPSSVKLKHRETKDALDTDLDIIDRGTCDSKSEPRQ